MANGLDISEWLNSLDSNSTNATNQATNKIISGAWVELVKVKKWYSMRLIRWNATNKRKEYVKYIGTLAKCKENPVYAAEAYRVTWPWYTQPKLNGIRCLAWLAPDGTVRLISRNGNPFAGLEHVRAELARVLPPGVTLDGELYIHGVPLQRLAGLVRKPQPGSERLEYHVYDVAAERVPLEDRLAKIPDLRGPCRYVRGVTVRDDDDLARIHAAYVGAGYEGTMLRRPGSMYAAGQRSPDLLKHKAWEEEEFAIVGGHAATGEHVGAVVFECVTAAGRRFSCVPRFPVEERRTMYARLREHVGQRLTVRYLELSADGIPTGCPVGVAIRNYE